MKPDEDVSDFDDPALRSAIRRVWSGASAPAELHGELAQAASDYRPRWYRHPAVTLAVAAMVLIAVGVITLRLGSQPAVKPLVAVLPVNLADNLVICHDVCCRAPDHHMPGLPHDDLAAIAVMLHTRLGYPVMSGEPSTAAWQFAGASICNVGDRAGAHLIFKQPDQNVSVFSLPVAIDPAATASEQYAMVEDGHFIAAFATQNGFYAVVGTSTDNSLSLANVVAMRDRLMPIVIATPAAQTGVAMAGW